MTSHSGNFTASSLTSSEAPCSWRRDCASSHSSRDGACSSPTTGEASRQNFSSSNLTGYGYHYTYPRVSVNKHLLAPLHLDIDPALQEIRAKEKEEIKTLNNQFAALIGKVQNLEQHNQVLLTRWNFLKEQDNSLSDLDIKLLYDRYMNKLNLEIRSVDAEKEQLDSELDEVLASMDDFRSKYEKEINKRTGMEFTFTTLKKDLDNSFLHKTELEMKLNGLHAWVELMNTIHEKELEEVMSQIKDVSIVLGIDNNRYMPDPHSIVEDVRAQYEDLAIRSWEELEALTRSKLNEREALSVKFGDHLLNDRRMIAELNIQIQKMRSCIVSLKSQCLHLEDNIKDVGLQGETALNDAKAKLAKLEDALHSARQDLAQLVKKYQELMNIKLALDIEILTYRRLIEGEEISMDSPPPAFISKIYSRPNSCKFLV
ncbi:keratin, type II cytoskeletal 80 isoform X2 [Candoia aspera]|uniref:keratin, type II cytoskeletal 80 isoform X2 n=1 Tax=Candoia aspera TaxID=51853 RepID=UPI002FD7CEAF